MIIPLSIMTFGGIVCVALASYAAYKRGRRDGIDECRDQFWRALSRQNCRHNDPRSAR